MMSVRNLFAAMFLTATVAAPASAATYDIDPQNPKNVFQDAAGQNAWYVPVNLWMDNGQGGANRQVAAGLFRVKEDLPGPIDRDFVAFCLSPNVWLNLNVDYSSGTGLSAAVKGALGALRMNAFDLVHDSLTAGAFQIAVWEIVADTGNLGVTDGSIRFTQYGGQSPGAISLAATWLGNIENGTWQATTAGMRFHRAEGESQDLLEIAPVPLPAGGGLLIVALAGLGVIARRSRKA